VNGTARIQSRAETITGEEISAAYIVPSPLDPRVAPQPPR